MNSVTLSVESVTYAYKARKMLARAGIRAGVVRIDEKRSKRGCTSGISFPIRHLPDAMRILSRAGITFERYGD